MSRTLAGVAILHGIDGTLSYGTVDVSKSKLLGGSLQDQWNNSEATDGKGNIISKCATGRRRPASFELVFIGSDAPSTTGSAKANSALPANAFTKITIAATGLTFLDGDW